MINQELKKYIDEIKDTEEFRRLSKLYNPNYPEKLIEYIYLNPIAFKVFFDEVQKHNFTLNNRRITDLSSIPYLNSQRFITSSTFARNWIILPDLNTALLKRIPDYEIYAKAPSTEDSNCLGSSKRKDIEDNEFHILLVPEISKQVNIQCAQYFLAKYDNSFGYSLSPNFLKENEELIPGNTVITKNGTYGMSYLLEDIEHTLKLRHFSPKIIEKIKFDFIKQCFFSKFIKNTDERNHNWGLIVSNNTARLSPFFDIDFSCDIYQDVYHHRVLDDSSITAIPFVNQYRNYPGFMDFLSQFINNFDIEKAFNHVKLKHSIEIPDHVKQNFRDFFEGQLEELMYIYSLCKKEKEGYIGDDER